MNNVGSSGLHLLPPEKIKPSAWANRHASAFKNQSYRELFENIRSIGKNIQPIKVRPISNIDGYDFEIVYGHRRHHVCLEIGLPVVSLIESLSDQELFNEMDRENRDRADLSPWEQGMHYRRALESGLYGSLRKLASALNVSHSAISTSVKLATLPTEVVDAFESPLDLQHRWASALAEAHQRDPSGLLERATAISSSGLRRSPKKVLTDLLDRHETGSDRAIDLTMGEKIAGRFIREKNGGITISLRPGSLNAIDERKLLEFIGRLGRAGN